MKAFNRSSKKKHKYGRYDGIKAIMEQSLEYDLGEFSHSDYYLENYHPVRHVGYGQPLLYFWNDSCGNSYGIKAFGSYRKLWRIHHESNDWVLVNLPEEYKDMTLFCKSNEVSTVYFNRFIVFKRGGVFDLKDSFWCGKKAFFKALRFYNGQKSLRGADALDCILSFVYYNDSHPKFF